MEYLLDWKSVATIGVLCTSIALFNHYQSQYIICVKVHLFNKEKKAYKLTKLCITFDDKNAECSVYDVKLKMSKQLNIPIDRLEIGEIVIFDDDHMLPTGPRAYLLRIKIPFIIKFFYGNNIMDIVENRNYETIELEACYYAYKLIDIINQNITHNKIMPGSLICRLCDTSFHHHSLLLISGYLHDINKYKYYIAQEVKDMIMRYYIINRDIDIRKTLIENNIYNGDKLILYKDFMNPFIEYNTIQHRDFMIKIKLPGFYKKEIELEINSRDSGRDVIGKLYNKSGERVVPHHQRNIHVLVHNDYWIRPHELDNPIIDYGIKPGSMVIFHAGTVRRRHQPVIIDQNQI